MRKGKYLSYLFQILENYDLYGWICSRRMISLKIDEKLKNAFKDCLIHFYDVIYFNEINLD